MDERDTGRRGALKALAVVGGAAACGAIAVPGVRMLVAPVRASGETARWIRTVKLEALAEGEPRKVSIIADAQDAWMMERMKELGSVWMIRRGSVVECFSAVCPHLGCTIAFETATGFVCPCHDSAFTGDGAKKSGPSPRGLDKLTTRITTDGFVEVDFRKFRQGVPERIEIG